jgi:hypothetical protein
LHGRKNEQAAMRLTDGGVYRVYRDRRSGAWFVEGEYD